MIAGLAVAGPAHAESSPGDLAAYIRARAADAAGEPDRAVSGYGLALAAEPGDPVIAVRAYRAAIAAGDYPLIDRARAVLERTDTAPADAAVLALSEAVRAGDAAASSAAIDRIAKGPLDFLAPSLRAWSLIGDPKASLSALDVAGSNPVGRRYASENRALLMIATGRTDDGLAMLQVVSSIDRKGVDLRVAAARLLVGQGKRDRAEALINGDDAQSAALRTQIVAGTASPAFGIGFVLTRLASDIGNGQAAKLVITLTRTVLRIDPDNDRARLLLAGGLQEEELPDRAIDALAAIGPTSPYHLAAEAQRATVLDGLGRRDEAIGIATALASTSGATSTDIRRQADLLTAASMFDRAAVAYRRAIAIDGSTADWTLYLQLGAALDRAGNWAKAQPTLERAVALAPDQAVALNYLGYGLLEHGGNVQTALKLLEKASMLKPRDLSILDSLAWAYFIGGDTARALPLLERAASGEPGNSAINEHLGDAYWRAGRRFEARYAWRAATVAAEPGDATRLASKIADGPKAQ